MPIGCSSPPRFDPKQYEWPSDIFAVYQRPESQGRGGQTASEKRLFEAVSAHRFPFNRHQFLPVETVKGEIRAPVRLALAGCGGLTVEDEKNGKKDAGPGSDGVGSDNRPPVMGAVGDKEVTEDESLEFNVSAVDEDGDPLNYEADGLPQGSTFIGGVFHWMPNYDFVSHPDLERAAAITFWVSDGRLFDQETINIRVLDKNRCPVFAPIEDRVIDEGEYLEFPVSIFDPDGDVLLYHSAINLPPGSDFTNHTFSWTPTFEQAGAYAVTFKTDDGFGCEAEKTVAITVNDARPFERPYSPDGHCRALYHFDAPDYFKDSCGAVEDNATNFGSIVADSLPGFGEARFFSELDRMIVPHSTDLDVNGEITVEARIRPEGPDNGTGAGGGWGIIVYKSRIDTYDGFALVVNSDGFWGQCGERIEANYQFPTEEFTHIALVCDQSQMMLHASGFPLVFASRTRPFHSVDDQMFIGGSGTYAAGFVGIIDEIRISDTARGF